MSKNIDRANELGIDSLKLIITIASGSLVFTVTFLKDILDGQTPALFFILILGWVFLFFSIFLSWIGLTTASYEIAKKNESFFLFSPENKGNPPKYLNNKFLTFLSFFIPCLPTKESNKVRKYAASAQNYILIGLSFLTIFAIVNYYCKFNT